MITPVRALKDNYVYVVVADGGNAAVVDPGEVAPVEAALSRLGVTLRAIWCTHHHWDHTDGVAGLVETHPGIDVVASRIDAARFKGVTRPLEDNDAFDFHGLRVEALLIPGHTLGAVAFRVGDDVFTGDTLFGACCGRLFEGTPEQMWTSLARLSALPDTTRFWCGHEYTLGCLKWAATVEPDNPTLRARLARVSAAPTSPTVPLSIVEERETNPFLRTGDPAAFAALRKAKDGWRG